jgi:hypothetical protein
MLHHPQEHTGVPPSRPTPLKGERAIRRVPSESPVAAGGGRAPGGPSACCLRRVAIAGRGGRTSTHQQIQLLLCAIIRCKIIAIIVHKDVYYAHYLTIILLLCTIVHYYLNYYSNYYFTYYALLNYFNILYTIIILIISCGWRPVCESLRTQIPDLCKAF